MLEQTAERVRGVVPDENILIVTGAELARAVGKNLPWLPKASILSEPVGRNTAPCIGWAALEARAREPNAVLAVLAADHLIGPTAEFRRFLRSAYALADTSRSLVTFGIKPTEPATGYGYIQAGESIEGDSGAHRVAAFHEKPTLAKARGYLRSGKYYWNSGMFAWRADVVLEEIRAWLPDLGDALERLEASRRRGRVPVAKLAEVYPRMASISIDYGVLERSDRVAMLPATFEWNDIGSWDSVASLWPRDEAGNAVRGSVVALGSTGNVVAAEGKTVALLGVDDLVVVDSGDALLVCRREQCQDVKAVVNELRRRGLDELL